MHPVHIYYLALLLTVSQSAAQKVVEVRFVALMAAPASRIVRYAPDKGSFPLDHQKLCKVSLCIGIYVFITLGPGGDEQIHDMPSRAE